MILGVMHVPVPYEEGTVELRAGDVLVLFTDGVSEAMSKDAVEYGEDRLLDMIRQTRSANAQEIITSIQQDVTTHSHGAPQSDDITMMVLKIGPPH
jgi:sigma-B regulation protein RsbU (phosphoserine phosphatase)